MPKSFFSDDPLAAAAEGRRPASVLLLLVVPFLGFILLGFGMHARPGAGASPLALSVDRPSRCEGRAHQLAAIETARRNVLHWRQENCGSASSPHSRAKLRAWEDNYRGRLELYARMYPPRRHSE